MSAPRISPHLERPVRTLQETAFARAREDHAKGLKYDECPWNTKQLKPLWQTGWLLADEAISKPEDYRHDK